jgi:VanZ family protein
VTLGLAPALSSPVRQHQIDYSTPSPDRPPINQLWLVTYLNQTGLAVVAQAKPTKMVSSTSRDPERPPSGGPFVCDSTIYIANRTQVEYKGRMFRKLIAVAAWACLIFIIYATLCAIEARPQLVGSVFYKAFFTVVERFGAYAVLGLLFCLAYPRNVTPVCFLVFGSAIVLELLQMFFPDRDARVLDALEKLAGGIAGITIAWALLRLQRNR